MISRLLSSWFLAALLDLALLAGAGVGAWWLFDAAVPAAWCAGGRWDGVFLFTLGLLFVGRNEGPAWGRRPWPRRALMVSCAAVATPVAVMAGRLIADCGDFEGKVTVWIMLPHFLAGLGIGLVTLAVYLQLAKRLPATENRKRWRTGEPKGVSGIIAGTGAIVSIVSFLVLLPDLREDAATALFDGYCPDPDANGIIYFVVFLILAGRMEGGGRKAWRTIGLAGLAAIALISVGYILPGLLLPCRSAGEDPTTGQWLLKSGIELASIALAVIVIQRLRPRPEAPDKDEPPVGETRS